MSDNFSAAFYRIGALFRRRRLAPWAPKERATMARLKKEEAFEDLGDLRLIELYYAFERKKGDKGIHRRDLDTFLNNWHGELDRARLWAEKFPNLAAGAKAVASEKAQPAGWDVFLAGRYPLAREKDFWRVPESVREEFKKSQYWEGK